MGDDIAMASIAKDGTLDQHAPQFLGAGDTTLADRLADISDRKVTTLRIASPAVVLGANAETDIAQVPFDATVVAARYIASSAIAGADTNTRKVAIVNKGQAGAGATEVAAKTFVSGVSAAADDATAITLHATPANQIVTEGDVLVVASTFVGTGLADPGGLVEIDLVER